MSVTDIRLQLIDDRVGVTSSSNAFPESWENNSHDAAAWPHQTAHLHNPNNANLQFLAIPEKFNLYPRNMRVICIGVNWYTNRGNFYMASLPEPGVMSESLQWSESSWVRHDDGQWQQPKVTVKFQFTVSLRILLKFWIMSDLKNTRTINLNIMMSVKPVPSHSDQLKAACVVLSACDLKICMKEQTQSNESNHSNWNQELQLWL